MRIQYVPFLWASDYRIDYQLYSYRLKLSCKLATWQQSKHFKTTHTRELSQYDDVVLPV